MTHRLSFVAENHQLHPSRLGPNSERLFIPSVAPGGNESKTNSFVGILTRVCEHIGHNLHLQPHP